MPDRRGFLLALAAASAALGVRRARGAQTGGGRPRPPKPGEIKLPAGATMPMRPLGRTGVKVSLLGIGGFHLGVPDEKEAIRIMHAALDHGASFFDNCWDYNNGASEERMGKALAEGGRRARVFLMTKLDGRTKKAAMDQLEQSLRRLRTDTIDLVQVHEVIRMNDPERVFAPAGAIEALLDARKAGKVRFIGFTGHKDPAMHLHMLDAAKRHGVHFDTVQQPVNVMDAHYSSFEKRVLPVLQREEIALLGMKALGSGVLLESGAVSPQECLRYSMSQPTSVVITGCDSMGVLEQALSVALGFKPLGPEEQRAILARTAGPAAGGRYELFKTSDRFDGTKRHPEWLERA